MKYSKEQISKNWKDIEFNETLELMAVRRGRSAANFGFKSTTKNDHYIVFMKDFLNMVKNNSFKDGIISGIFIIKKRGRNFDVCLKDTPNYEPKWEYDNYNFPIPEYI